jgi:hypothetical protein
MGGDHIVPGDPIEPQPPVYRFQPRIGKAVVHRGDRVARHRTEQADGTEQADIFAEISCDARPAGLRIPHSIAHCDDHAGRQQDRGATGGERAYGLPRKGE